MKSGSQLAEEGIAKVDTNASEEWKRLALDCIVDVAIANQFFLTDDVWVLIKKRHPDARVHNKSALGAVMREAIKLGAMYQPVCVLCALPYCLESKTPKRHRGANRMWKSRIHFKYRLTTELEECYIGLEKLKVKIALLGGKA